MKALAQAVRFYFHCRRLGFSRRESFNWACGLGVAKFSEKEKV
jgi:hypothetical protein